MKAKQTIRATAVACKVRSKLYSVSWASQESTYGFMGIRPLFRASQVFNCTKCPLVHLDIEVVVPQSSLSVRTMALSGIRILSLGKINININW
jgi:hypothetical protein